MPTPAPGLKRVPRWRTMISPPVTTCPANVLTPSRCALESRPLRLEPSPFLCAIAALLVLLGRRSPFRFRFWRLFALRLLGGFGFASCGRFWFGLRGRFRFGLPGRFWFRGRGSFAFGRRGRFRFGRRRFRALGRLRRRLFLVRADLADLDARERLAVTGAALVAALGLEL